MKKRRTLLRTVCLLLTAGFAVLTVDAAGRDPQMIRMLNEYLLTQAFLFPADELGADADGNGILNAVDLTLHKRRILAEQSAQYQGLCINEICSSNHAAYKAPDGTSPDWIELYNAGEAPCDLSGCGISDRPDERYRLTVPAGTMIPSGGYLLILCDGGSAELHAPFKLSASGETVCLTAPRQADGTTGRTLDSVTVPALAQDVTYARYPDGGAWTQCSASAGTANTDAEPLIAAPVFSHTAGFYDDAFDLTLTAPENCRIFCTLDGSDPRSSDTAKEYASALHIYDNSAEPNRLSAIGGISSVTDFVPTEPVEKGMVIRAVCKSPSGIYSKVVTNGYFIGKTAPYYRSLRVCSISTDPANLFDSESGIYLQKNCMNKGREWERPVHIQVYEDGKAVYGEDVGMRIAGNWSRNYPQKSLTFYARSDYGASKMHYDFFAGGARDCTGSRLTSFDKVTLRNGGDGYDAIRFRDDLNAYLAEGLAIGTQAKYDYVVFINGEFWGCYSMQEKLGDDYLEAHYHVPKENITTVKNTLCEGDESLWAEYQDFFRWAKDADFSQPENDSRFCDVIDVQSMIDWIAAESIVCNWDALVNVNNTMIWRANQPDAANPYADGKWRFLFFDTEYSSGFSGTGADYDYLAKMERSDAPNCFGTLFYALLGSDDFRARFRASYEAALEQHFTAERASAQIDRYLEQLSAVYLDTAVRFGIDMNAEKLADGAEGVRDFWNRRGAYASAQMEACLSVD